MSDKISKNRSFIVSPKIENQFFKVIYQIFDLNRNNKKCEKILKLFMPKDLFGSESESESKFSTEKTLT